MDQKKLNRRIIVIAPGAKTPDGMGGFSSVPGLSSELWCSAKQLSARDSLVYGLDLKTASFKFCFRYESAKNITTEYGLTYEGKAFRIISIEEKDEAKDEIIIVANVRS